MIEKAIGKTPPTDVAAMAEAFAIATKVDAPKVTERQVALTGSVRCVQVMPSAIRLKDEAIIPSIGIRQCLRLQ